MVVEIVRGVTSSQYPSLMPTLYPGRLMTASQPIAMVADMWSAFEVLATRRQLSMAKDSMRTLPAGIYARLQRTFSLMNRLMASRHPTKQHRHTCSGRDIPFLGYILFLIDGAPYPKLVGNRQFLFLHDYRSVPRPCEVFIRGRSCIFLQIGFWAMS